jgi:ABC-type thiamine transport system ATPase subunit
LARALYQCNDIYLFDDIFSSLDAHVADSIFEKAIIGYLIKERHATVVLVTSHYHFLSNSNLNLNVPNEDEKNND